MCTCGKLVSESGDLLAKYLVYFGSICSPNDLFYVILSIHIVNVCRHSAVVFLEIGAHRIGGRTRIFACVDDSSASQAPFYTTQVRSAHTYSKNENNMHLLVKKIQSWLTEPLINQ